MVATARSGEPIIWHRDPGYQRPPQCWPRPYRFFD
jgi:hypothetical protein